MRDHRVIRRILSASLWILLAVVPAFAQSESSEGCGGCGKSGKTMCGKKGDAQGGMKKGGCGHGGMQKGGKHGGMNHGGMNHGGMRGGDNGRSAMAAIHELIGSHESISREVETIPEGVVTVTRTSDPELVATLQRHVAEMYQLLESGGRIRGWDPLFVEIFEHADSIDMEMEMLDDGIRVRETSADPYVVQLIQAHAAKVDEFVARGREAMHEPTPVPDPGS